MLLTDSDMLDKPVVTKDGHVIGAITSVILDTSDWKVVELRIKLKRESLDALGLKKPWIRSPEVTLPVGELAGISDEAVLRSNAADLDFADGESVDAPKDKN